MRLMVENNGGGDDVFSGNQAAMCSPKCSIEYFMTYIREFQSNNFRRGIC